MNKNTYDAIDKETVHGIDTAIQIFLYKLPSTIEEDLIQFVK